MSQATDVLRHEHEAILLALQILERIAKRARDGGVDAVDIAQFLGFLREFADTCHHGKEEQLLFPAMTAAGLPSGEGPITVMLAEHEYGRELVRAMADAGASPVDGDRFAQAANDYVTHLRAHIDKENNVLFPLADRLLDPATLAGLHDGFERHEEEVMGHGRHQELHAMLRDMRTRYLEAG